MPERRFRPWWAPGLLACALTACGADPVRFLDADTDLGPGLEDLGPVDTGFSDAGPADAGSPDTGTADAGPSDVGPMDAGPTDTGPMDTGPMDTGPADTGPMDAGPTDAGVADTGADAAAADASLTEAGTDAAGPDAGSAFGTPVVDGRIGNDWPGGAIVTRNTVPSGWGPTLNALRALHVAWDSTHLYLGLDGVVEEQNALAIYIDRDFIPEGTATGVTSIASLTDGDGALDDALSCGVLSAPAGFGADVAWGTRGMRTKTASALDAFVGLRDIACTGCAGNFRWLMGDAAVCVRGDTPGCEVSIPWTALYNGAQPPPRPRLGLFVRVTNERGTDLSNNQTLPQQTPPEPTVARQVLSFSPTL